MKTSSLQFGKVLSTALLMLLLGLAGKMFAYEEITIGDGGTSTNYYIPSYSHYKQSITQQIYTADELGSSGYIFSIAFYNIGTERTRNFDFYLVGTNKEAFDNGSDWVAVTADDLVFSGSVTMTPGEWTWITLDTPFFYDGVENVVLVVDDNTGSYTGSSSQQLKCRVFSAAGTQALYKFNDNTNYDPYNLSGVSGSSLSVKNQIKIKKTAVLSGSFDISVGVNLEGVGAVEGAGTYSFGDQCTLTAIANDGYSFNNWTLNGEVVSTNPTLTFAVYGDASYVANFEEGYYIGDHGSTPNAFIPSYSYYSYSLSQQIYTADEIGSSGYIYGISFYNVGTEKTRLFDIFIRNTNAEMFNDNYDWITVAENNLVFSGSVITTPNEWGWILFDTPFFFDGTSNIVLVVDDNTGGYSGGQDMQASFRVFSTEGTQAIYKYSDDTNLYPYNSYEGSRLSVKNQIKILKTTELTGSFEISASVNPEGAGTIDGIGTYGFGSHCTLTAMANEGYAFNYWTMSGELASTNSTFVFGVYNDATYVANFEEGSYIGDNGIATDDVIPSRTASKRSLSEQIYTSDEMGGKGNIDRIAFYNTGEEVTRTFDIYMVNTEKETFSHDSDWIPVEEYNLVFSDSVTMTANGWVWIDFDTPFAYDGISNVALIIDDNTDWIYSNMACRVFDATGTQVIYKYSSSDINPYNTSEIVGSRLSIKNQILFRKISVPDNSEITTVVNPEGAGTTDGAGTYEFAERCTISATANEGYAFNNWTFDGTIVSNSPTYTFLVGGDATYVANFEEGHYIGDHDVETNGNIPINSYYKYSLSQQIYTAREIGDGGYIVSLSFYNVGAEKTRDLDIYMINTDKEFFESSTDWITVLENDLVFSGSVTMTPNAWTRIELDQLFVYDGISNVALIVDDNTGSYTGDQNTQMSCRVFGAESTQAIYIYSDGSNYDPFSVSNISGTLLSVKNQVLLGKMESGSFDISASVNTEGAGTVEGAGTYEIGVQCTLTATANQGYAFINWSLNGMIVSNSPTFSFFPTEDASYVANFEEGYYIGDYSMDTYNIIPSNTYYKYSLTQQIYTAAELGGAAIIDSIAFYNAGVEKTRNIDIYLTNTDQVSFDENIRIDLNENDLVFSGSVTMPANEWTWIAFDTPFFYDGVSNMVLTVDDNTGGYTGNADTQMACRVFNTESSQARYEYTDNYNLDPFDPSIGADYQGRRSFKNQLLLRKEIPSGSFDISTSVNIEGAGTIEGAGNYEFGTQCTLTATANEGYAFSNWTLNGTIVSNNPTYSIRVRKDDSYVANFVEGYYIGDHGLLTDETLPSFTYWNYSFTQQIYTANELGGIGYFNRLAFYNTGIEATRSFDIYIVSTYKENFDHEDDWIAVSENDLVFSGSVTMSVNGWTWIEFDTPYAYDGVSNMALVVDDNTGSWTENSMACRAFYTEGSQSIGFYADDLNCDPFNLSYSSSSLLGAKNQILLDKEIPSGSFDISTSVNIEGAGTIEGAGNYEFGTQCTLTATANEGFVFVNWTKDGTEVSTEAEYSFVVAGNAAFVANFGLPLTIPGYGTGSGNYRFIASPLVENAAPVTVEGMTDGANYDLYRFDQSEALEWQNYKANTDNFALVNGQGYLYANAEDVDLVFTGVFNEDATKEVSLVYDAGKDCAGWNLVGNPFPTQAYVDRSYYVMNEGGTAIEPVALSSGTAIPACTGVMVKAENTGETVVFSRTPSGKSANNRSLQITVVQEGDNSVCDKAIVSFNAGEELGKMVFNEGKVKLYIPKDGKDYAIACAQKQGEVPLHFKSTENGDYTLKIEFEGMEMGYLHLFDTKTGAEIDLLQTPSYTFEAQFNDDAVRFKLVFKP